MILPFCLLAALGGCSRSKGPEPPGRNEIVVEGIEGDVDGFNPLFSQDANAGEINDLLYPGLMSARFDTATGVLEYRPSVARSWEIGSTNPDVTFHLRAGLQWSDGAPLTARDVQLSYELYGDTAVASVRQTSLDGLKKNGAGVVDAAQAVEVPNDSTVVFHFDHVYPGRLFDAGLPILPAHLFATLPRNRVRDDSAGRHPLSSGPFLMRSWKPLEQIELVPNASSLLPHPGRLSRLIFRVIPDYRSRLMQLKSGELDIVPYVNTEDAAALTRSDTQIAIVPLGERFYDAINWNNIDRELYARSKGKTIRPHPLFGSAKVRRALTLAIDRREIVDTYLRPFGREAIGPVSPLFRWAYNDSLKPLPFDAVRAAALLREEGWKDSDGDGILDKAGRKFSFVLKIPAGNQLRAAIASVVQARLRALGIEVKIEQLERSVFWGDLMEKQFDACIAGFNVPLQMQLDELWGGDLARSRFNLVSFRNRRVDEILAGGRLVAKETDHAAAWKEFQEILQREQPCTFLYWMNDLVAVNRRVRGTSIGALGVASSAGEWSAGPDDDRSGGGSR